MVSLPVCALTLFPFVPGADLVGGYLLSVSVPSTNLVGGCFLSVSAWC